MAEARSGLVVALQANYCWVELDGPLPLSRLLCTRRSRLGKTGQSICVGDRVWVDGIDWAAGRGAVASREPRRSLLQRPAVANVSKVVVVVSLAEPALDPLQLTRFLLTAEATGQPVRLVFSKTDCLPPQALQAWQRQVRGWGYEALATSSRTGAGLEALRDALSEPGIAVLCGPSGVGKSSLLNGLRPELALRVAAVSGRLQRGRHTTRHVELFALAPGALLADTPGFNRPELPADPAALAPLFPELRLRLAEARCRYANCLHQGDPGCAAGTDWDRYDHYQHCLEALSAEAIRKPLGAGEAAANGLKQRGNRSEPRLNKRQRQPSRRRQRQQLSPPDPADSDHP
jgi:ribosome biogenesis GTPase / thiamine phosphate phosphatase